MGKLWRDGILTAFNLPAVNVHYAMKLKGKKRKQLTFRIAPFGIVPLLKLHNVYEACANSGSP